MEVRDTKLTVPCTGKGYVHCHTKEQPRLSDGHSHPVTIVQKGK